MSILRWLGLAGGEATDTGSGGAGSRVDSQAVADIAARLEPLGRERARYVAAFAMTLARAARADLEVVDRESSALVKGLEQTTDLPRDEAELVAEMALHRNQLLGVSEDYLATRAFRDASSREQRLQLLDAAFAICAADDSITLVEEEEVRQIADELGLEHEEYVTVRSRYRDQREVLRGLRPPTE